jgi:twitching motility protein PilT
VTIEDPIEFVHRDRRSIVSQREVGPDTKDFPTALRHALRQSPDVLFIGEMRDIETISTAISAALTGHLVVTTLHTADVTQTLERIVNYYPEHLREQVALDLSIALAGITSQRLLTRKDGNGLIPAVELLLMTPLARRLIAERRLGEIEDVIKAGEADGMQTFTQALTELVRAEQITVEAGRRAATNPEEFLLNIEGLATGSDTLREEGSGKGARGFTMKSLLRAAVKVSEEEVKQDFVHKNTRVKLHYVRFSPVHYRRLVRIDPQRIAAYIKDHSKEIKDYFEKNRTAYEKLPAQVRLQMIKVRLPADSAAREVARVKAGKMM